MTMLPNGAEFFIKDGHEHNKRLSTASSLDSWDTFSECDSGVSEKYVKLPESNTSTKFPAAFNFASPSFVRESNTDSMNQKLSSSNRHMYKKITVKEKSSGIPPRSGNIKKYLAKPKNLEKSYSNFDAGAAKKNSKYSTKFYDGGFVNGDINSSKKILKQQISGKYNSLPPNSSLLDKQPYSKSPTVVDHQTEKMKSKLLSVWNNVKYGWSISTRTNFSVESPTVILGRVYHETEHDMTRAAKIESGILLGRPMNSPIENFKLDFSSRIWLTYRKNFPPLSGSILTTDCGWGCMLRGAQMLLAEALVCHLLGRSWRCTSSLQTEKSEMYHRTIVKWFTDSPSSLCPLSLHHLVDIGRQFGKKPGDWYGPASAAHIIKLAVENASSTNPLLDKVCVYVAQDCTVYEEDIVNLCTSPSHLSKFPTSRLSSMPRENREEIIEWADVVNTENEDRNSSIYCHEALPTPPVSPLTRTWSNPLLNSSDLQNGKSMDFDGENCRSIPVDMRPLKNMQSFGSGDKWRGLIILIPVRLGGEKLNPIYIPCLKRLLAHESCLGIIGGKPKHALYFIGFQGDKLIHLDPHYCQETENLSDFSLNSYHCTVPKTIPVSKMDPSCTIGFYLRTREDFHEFSTSITPLLTPGTDDLEYPMFVFSKGCRKNILPDLNSLQDELQFISNNSSSSENESDAFVLL